MVTKNEIETTIKIVRSDRAKVLARMFYEHQDEFLSYMQMRKLTKDDGNIGAVRGSLKSDYGFVFEMRNNQYKRREFKLITIVPTPKTKSAYNSVVENKIDNMTKTEKLLNKIWR